MTHPKRPRGRPRGSDTRERLLKLVSDEYLRTGIYPVRDGLSRSLGISPQAVSGHITRLIKAGLLPEDANARDWAVRVRGAGARIPVLARSAAGPPLLAIPEQDPLDLVALLTSGYSDVWSVWVDGDSLDGPPLWILPGSYCICRRTPPEAAEGDIAVCRLIDEGTLEATVTLKQIRHDPDGRLVLHPLNPRAQDIHPSPGQRVDILGVAVAVVRQLPR